VITIANVTARSDWTLEVVFGDGSRGTFDMRPLLVCEAFQELEDPSLFRQVRNQRYFIEWPNGADLSADTLKLAGSATSHGI
jgi:hypothetical protein